MVLNITRVISYISSHTAEKKCEYEFVIVLRFQLQKLSFHFCLVIVIILNLHLNLPNGVQYYY